MTRPPRFGLRRDLARPDGSERSDRVTYVELFFDLIFVFALTQLSSYLSENQTPLGALEGFIMVLALWWVWISTTWVTNWLDPAKLPVRGVVMALALMALVLSTSIADSFGERAWVFAVTYVVMQLSRTAFMVIAMWRHDREDAMTFARIFLWLAVGGVFWIVGALLPLPWQLPLWGIALAIEYVSVTLDFRVPGLGRSKPETWDLSGPHLAERAALFVLIALGESFLVTGFAFVELELAVESVVTLLGAFVAAAAMWWIYFDHGERLGAERIAKSDSPGRLARTAYTYIHVAVIAGIVVTSVADKELLSHPFEMSVSTAMSVLGGPALFLLGTLLFRRVVENRWRPTHIAGIAALALAALLAPAVTPLVLGLVATGVLVSVAATETLVRAREGKKAGG